VSISTSPSVRCPRCSAHVRAGSDWCTLCYADLRPVPPEPPAAVEPSKANEDVNPSEQPALRRGKHAKSTSEFGASAVEPVATVEALADQMLAELAASQSTNPLGPLAGVVDSTGKRIGLMIGGTVAAIFVLIVVMAAIGTLL